MNVKKYKSKRKKHTYPENNMRKKHHREDPNEGEEEEDPVQEDEIFSRKRMMVEAKKNANIQRQQPQTNGEKSCIRKWEKKNQSKSR